MSSVGYNPRWDDELTLKVHVPELAVVNFTVYTKDAFVAQYSLPFTSILQGVSVCLAYQSARYNELYRRTYVLLRLLIPSFCLLALRSHNQRMDSSRVCYEQLGYGVVLTSRDWILHIVPLFLGRWGNCPEFCHKYDGAVIWRVVVFKRLNI